MVSLSPNFRKWAGRISLILGTATFMIGGMFIALQVKAMITPEAQKTIEELYDLKKANGVTLRSLNTVKMKKELELATINRQIADVQEENARADICIDQLQSGKDERCDVDTMTTSGEASSSSSSSTSSEEDLGF